MWRSANQPLKSKVICCFNAQDYSRNLSLLVSKVLSPVYLGVCRPVYYHMCERRGLQNRQEEHRMDQQEDRVKGVVGGWAGERWTVWLEYRRLATGCCSVERVGRQGVQQPTPLPLRLCHTSGPTQGQIFVPAIEYSTHTNIATSSFFCIPHLN